MNFLVLLATLLLAYVAIGFFTDDSDNTKFLRGVVLTVGVGIAVFSAVAIQSLVDGARWGKKESIIAWTGVSAVRDASLVIGGDDGLALWPDGAREPRLELTKQSAGLLVGIKGGSGFVYERAGGHVLNGVPLLMNTKRLVGKDQPFAVTLRKDSVFGSTVLSIDSANESVHLGNSTPVPLGWDLPLLRRKRPLVLEGTGMVRLLVSQLRAEGNIQSALQLERWAEGVLLLVQPDKSVRILDTADAQQLSVPENEAALSWQILRPGRPFSFQTSASTGRARVDFLPPHRIISPLPPTGDKDYRPGLVVTSGPIPGEYSFTLPFGTHARDPRFLWDPSSVAPVAPQARGTSPKVAPAPTEAFSVPLESDKDSNRAELVFSRVENQVQSSSIRAVLVLAALALLGGGLLLWRLSSRDLWAVFGLGLVACELLSIRLLLALRYGLDPTRLDPLAVKGIAESAAAVCFLPGLVFLAAALHVLPGLPGNADPKPRKKMRNFLLLFLIITGALSVHALGLPGRIWPNLQASLLPGLFSRMNIFTLGVVSFLGMHAFIRFKPRSIRGNPSDFSYDPVYLLQRAILQAKDSWGRAAVPGLFWLVMAVIALFLGYFISGQTKLFEELLIPLFVLWPAVFTWLGVVKEPQPAHIKKTPPVALALWGFSRFLVPAILVPIFIKDLGSLYATVSVFGSLLLMLIALRKWNRHTLTVGICVSLILLLGGVAFLRVLDDPSLLRNARFAASRVIAWNNDGRIQEKRLIGASVDKTSGLNEDNLRNALEHSWENLAMAHEGGPRGKGFGEAPAYASQVPQSTLQFDSVFSFFILGDFGLAGGVALLILFAVPFAVLLIHGRNCFDMGHAVSVLFAFNLFLQAGIQAAMNLGILPFTGRNIPWLAVSSFSNLILWGVIFFLMGQALLWRRQGVTAAEAHHPDWGPELPPLRSSLDSRNRRGWLRFARPYFPYVAKGFLALLLVLPVLLIVLILPRAQGVVDNRKLETFDMKPMQEELARLIQEKVISLRVPEDVRAPFKIAVAPEHAKEWGSHTRLWQEIACFNALPREEQAEGSRLNGDTVFVGPEGQETTLGAWAGSVRNPKDYQGMLAALRDQIPAHLRTRRVSWFRVDLHPGEGEESTPSLALNPSAGYRFRMSPQEQKPGGFKSLVLATMGSESIPQSERILAGQAWVRGRVVLRSRSDMPWLDDLVQALAKDAGHGLLPGAQKVQLTLIPRLQDSSQSFIEAHGRTLHQEILADPVIQREVQKGERSLALVRPRRVAVAMVSIPDGKVLALGSWPRPSGAGTWKQIGDEWMPEGEWIRTKAPLSLRTAYSVDHNFSTSVAMGSASKPLWATVALRLHPELDSTFAVQGGPSLEHDVFGIPLGMPWEGDHAAGVVDFSTYLQKSSNRYQVRLGFLALADREGGRLRLHGGGASDRELFGGKPGMVPNFPSGIGFSKDHPATFMSLHKTPMAEMFQSTFGIRVESITSSKGFPIAPRKPSLWTGRESDDLVIPSDPDGFWVIAPEATNFELDRLSTNAPKELQADGTGPRAFVSLLLGSRKNRWSNVEFCGAFGTAVTGMPIVPHIIEGLPPSTDRKPFKVSAPLQRGLAGVLLPGGTAFSSLGPEARAALDELRHAGIKAYAKTGTLLESDEPGTDLTRRQTSRIVLALVNESPRNRGKGVVISILAERAAKKSGLTSEWMGQYLSENLLDIRAALGLPARQMATSAVKASPALKVPAKPKATPPRRNRSNRKPRR